MQLQEIKQTNSSQLLKIAESYLTSIVAPQAEIIDQDSEALKTALKGLGDRNLLGLRVPQKWGGGEFKELEFRQFQLLISRTSGALAFLQTQHQSAAAQIVASNKRNLQDRYLPAMTPGKTLIGVGFSQLRRPGEPIMTAIPTPGGYLLNGTVPWVTGCGFFEQFIIGATLPDGKALYGIVPLKNIPNQIQLSPPLELAVMKVTNTVKVNLQNWFLEESNVLTIKPPQAIHDSDKKNVLHHGFFALGTALAALEILKQSYHKNRLPFLQQAYQTLQQEVNHCRESMFTAISNKDLTFPEKLQLRAWTINLAGKCAQAAVTTSSGAANSLSHPAQRIYREAMMFRVSGQTSAVMEATLNHLLDT